jgi:hypothetical protein
MKQAHSDIIGDFKSGILKWGEISLVFIQREGQKLIEKIRNSTEPIFVEIRDKIFSEAKADLSILKK